MVRLSRNLRFWREFIEKFVLLASIYRGEYTLIFLSLAVVMAMVYIVAEILDFLGR